jgi:Cft2 family RNA processing exonuclease
VSINYHRPFSPVAGVTASFLDAGHILGSAIVVLDIVEGGQQRRLVFSGDLGRQDMAILRDPEPASDADFLIIESTYGNRRHETRDQARQVLRQAIIDTHKRRGKVIIPAFAVGRTQELVYALHQLSEAQKIPSLDIYVDSPLAVDVTEIFRAHPECYDEETLALLQQARADRKLVLRGRELAVGKDLAEDAVTAAFAQVFLPAELALPRDEPSFRAGLEAGRARIVPEAERFFGLVGEILGLREDCAARLARGLTGPGAAAAAGGGGVGPPIDG